MYGDTPGGDDEYAPMDVEAPNEDELPPEQKLMLAERANEIYRQQLKYMQDHLQSLRSLIQDKESIIENLMLRYDLGILQQDQSRGGHSLSPDEMDSEELRRKAEALAQRTILENFELRVSCSFEGTPYVATRSSIPPFQGSGQFRLFCTGTRK